MVRGAATGAQHIFVYTFEVKTYSLNPSNAAAWMIRENM